MSNFNNLFKVGPELMKPITEITSRKLMEDHHKKNVEEIERKIDRAIGSLF